MPIVVRTRTFTETVEPVSSFDLILLFTLLEMLLLERESFYASTLALASPSVGPNDLSEREECARKRRACPLVPAFIPTPISIFSF